MIVDAVKIAVSAKNVIVVCNRSLWQEDKLRPAVGLGLNIPIRTGRRRAAVQEAEARFEQLRAQLAQGVSAVAMEVQIAYVPQRCGAPAHR